MPRRLARKRIPKGRASPGVVARPLVFLVVIAGGLGRVANQVAAGPCNEPTGRALPRAKALQHVLSDAGVTKSDEEGCIASIRRASAARSRATASDRPAPPSLGSSEGDCVSGSVDASLRHCCAGNQAGHQPVAVVLDFVQPAGAGRRAVGR